MVGEEARWNYLLTAEDARISSHATGDWGWEDPGPCTRPSKTGGVVFAFVAVSCLMSNLPVSFLTGICDDFCKSRHRS